MKKILISLSILLGAIGSANAQNPGQMWLGGSVGFTHEKIEKLSTTDSYNIIPEFGYIVSENLGIGIALGYAHQEVNIQDQYYGDYTKNKYNGYTVAPFARYSFLKGNMGSLFIDGGGKYTRLKNKANDLKVIQYEIGLRPGVAITVSEKINLTAKFGFLGYEHQKEEYMYSSNYQRHEGNTKTDKFGLNLDMSQILLGMNLVF